MEAFRNAVDNCVFRDLGFVGQRFTWCNGRIGDQRTLIKLDRVVEMIDGLGFSSKTKYITGLCNRIITFS